MHLRLRFFAVVVLALPFATSGLMAQGLAGERREIAVSVVDQDGNLVEGLTAENFRGEFRGRPVNIESVVVQGGLKNVAVFLDKSKSGSEQWARIWTALEDLIISLEPPHLVTVFTFGEDLVVHGTAPAGWDPEQARAALVELQKKVGQPEGSTALYDALLTAADIKISGKTPAALYVISDGVDTTSKAMAASVERVLAMRGVRLFFLLLPPAPDEDSRAARRGRRDAQELTKNSGGLLFDLSRHWPSGDDPFTPIRPMYLSMVRNYVLSVSLPARVDKQRKWKLEVVDENGKKLKKVTLAYPRYLAPLPELPND